MASLSFLILFLSTIAGIYYNTRHISSIKKRIALAIGMPLLFCYILFFKSWTTTIFTPLYCLVHSNTKIKEHITYEDWKKMQHKEIDINLFSQSEYSVFEPQALTYSYKKNIKINNIDYEAFLFNQNIQNLLIYTSNNNNLFGKYIYLYYDINIDKPIISIADYVSEYRGISGNNNVWHCNDNALSDLRNYFMENYLNKQ